MPLLHYGAWDWAALRCQSGQSTYYANCIYTANDAGLYLAASLRFIMRIHPPESSCLSHIKAFARRRALKDGARKRAVPQLSPCVDAKLTVNEQIVGWLFLEPVTLGLVSKLISQKGLVWLIRDSNAAGQSRRLTFWWPQIAENSFRHNPNKRELVPSVSLAGHSGPWQGQILVQLGNLSKRLSSVELMANSVGITQPSAYGSRDTTRHIVMFAILPSPYEYLSWSRSFWYSTQFLSRHVWYAMYRIV